MTSPKVPGRQQNGTSMPRVPGILGRWVLAGALVASLAAAAPAQARDEGYDPQKAGNPLRIVYYAVYPVAFLVDWVIFRPAYYIGQCEPFQTIFGRQPSLSDIEAETSTSESDESDDS